jgi:cobalt-zinc-cadmium efflux system protein
MRDIIFTDSIALVLAWVAFYWQAKLATEQKTHGYGCAGVLAAFVNALALVILTLYIFHESYHRLAEPHEVNARWMILVASFGLVIDTGVSLALMRKAKSDLNIRTAFLHTAADDVSTAGIVVGGLLIHWTGRQEIDSILSFLIGGLILLSSVGIIRETLNILLEGLPRGIRLDSVVAAMRQVEGVVSVHDVHIWSLGTDTHALSCHVEIDDIPASAASRILKELNQMLEGRFRFCHMTIQLEHHSCDNHPACYVPEIAEPSRLGTSD